MDELFAIGVSLGEIVRNRGFSPNPKNETLTFIFIIIFMGFYTFPKKF